MALEGGEHRPGLVVEPAVTRHGVAEARQLRLDLGDPRRRIRRARRVGPEAGRGSTGAAGSMFRGQRPMPAVARARQSNSSPGSRLRAGATSEWPSTRPGGIGWRARIAFARALRAVIWAAGNGR